MAEMAIWKDESMGKDDGKSANDVKRRLSDIIEVLRRRWNRSRGLGVEEAELAEEVVKALKQLVGMMEAEGSNGDEAAADFGRMGGHGFLLDVLDKYVPCPILPLCNVI